MSPVTIQVLGRNVQWITLLMIAFSVNVFINSVEMHRMNGINEDWADPLDTYNYDRFTKTMRTAKSKEKTNHDRSPNVVEDTTTYKVGFNKCSSSITNCQDIPDPRILNTITETSSTKVDYETSLDHPLHTRSEDVSRSVKVYDSSKMPGNKKINSKDKDDMHTIFLKRFINLLLNAAGLTHGMPGTDRHAEISISVTSEDLETLKNFARDESVVSLHKLDEILSKMLHSSASNWLKSVTVVDWMEKISHLLGSKEIYYMVPYMLLLLTVPYMLLWDYSMFRIVVVIIFMMFIISFMMTYDYMQEVAEIKQFVNLKKLDYPQDCLPESKMSLWYWIKSSFGYHTDNCHQYYESVRLDPRAKVTPAIVLAELGSAFLLYPVEHVGNAVVKFSNIILGGLPIFSNWIIFAFCGVAVLIMILVVLVVSFGGIVKLPYYLGGLEMTTNQQHKRMIEPALGNGPVNTSKDSLATPSSNSLEGRLVININIPSLVPHRQIVEDLSPATTIHSERTLTVVPQPSILQAFEEVENCSNKTLLNDESKKKSSLNVPILDKETSSNNLEDKVTEEFNMIQSTQSLSKDGSEETISVASDFVEIEDSFSSTAK